MAFWRSWSRRLFQELCHLGEGANANWSNVAPPSDAELDRLVADAPPMHGLEYLTADLLRDSWTELRDLVATRATTFPEGPGAFLQSINPIWHVLGRVTFHLAENKRDPDRPFAFLATYTHQMGQKGQVQHLPLAEALRTYAGAKEQAKLAALLDPVRRAAHRSELVRGLLDTRALFSPQSWTIAQAHRFLVDSSAIEEAGVVVRVPNWWSAHRTRPQVQVQIGARPSSEIGLDRLLDFQVHVALGGEPLTEAERRQLLAGTEGLMLLRGQWVEVDREKLQQALDHWQKIQDENADGIDFIKGMRLLAGAQIENDESVDQEMNAWSEVKAGNWLRETLERLRHPVGDKQCQPGRDLNAKLRPYQIEGVNWLWFMTELGLGACLADDMGLGKTVQVIDLILQQKRNRPAGPSLLIIPASLIGNWKQELARFAPSLRIFVAHRSECDPDDLAKRVAHADTAFADYEVVITTYGLARRQEWLAAIPWSLVVLDEAQAIKNASSAQTRERQADRGEGPYRADRDAGRESSGRSLVDLRFLLSRLARLGDPIQEVRQAAQRARRRSRVWIVASVSAAVHPAPAQDRPGHCAGPARKRPRCAPNAVCRKSRRRSTRRP